MMKPIYYVGGSKGGVGKSLVSIALIDYLKIKKQEKVLLVETDTSNPDVYKVYSDTIPAVTINLDNSEGWIELLNNCHDYKDAVVVINSAARSNDGIKNYGELLTQAVGDLKRQLVVFWVINGQRDSLELLLDFKNAMPTATIHVVCNQFFFYSESISDFKIYDQSKVKKDIESSGGKSLLFSSLTTRISNRIYNDRMTIEGGVGGQMITYGDRVVLAGWRNEVYKMFNEAIA
jgi:hypothetical protein